MLDFPVLRRYSPRQVQAIALPVGGIGTGCFCLTGQGALSDWQLMSRPHRHWKPPYAHILLWVRTHRGKRYLRVLDSALTHLDADHGAPDSLAGIPRMHSRGFEATYPYGRALLSDALLPLHAHITAFSPLIPEATDDSSLPFGLLEIELENRSQRPLEASLIFLLTNFIGSDGIQSDLRDNLSEFASVAGWTGLLFRKAREARDPRWGSLVLLAEGGEVIPARRWQFRDRPWQGERLGI
ncbi:MAG: GH116 family glycosyl-hydrolase, partial [Fimbriimonadales bacterium]